ncbi:unnamed protein product [Blepharisma stoltei]|uniref:COPI associated protein n=1 Tax=Blepharisma stoltei TaxID=1481888 RepID=A0AAU9JVB6_9CILI|nr:unnamed protein product [Blepharisma stoltei]
MVGQEISDVRLSTFLKILTIIAGIGLIALSVYKFTRLSFSGPRDFSLTVYYIIFGFLVFFGEMPCKCFISFFSFLGFYIGKAIFCFFLGTIIFYPSNIWYLILSIAFFTISAIYFVFALSCKNKLIDKDDNPKNIKSSEGSVPAPFSSSQINTNHI